MTCATPLFAMENNFYPVTRKLHRDYGDRVHFVAVILDDFPSRHMDFRMHPRRGSSARPSVHKQFFNLFFYVRNEGFFHKAVCTAYVAPSRPQK